MKKCFGLLMALLLCAAIGLAAGDEAATRYEFEDGTLLGGAKALSYDGRGWVERLNKEGDGVTVTVTVAEDGFYDLTVNQQGIGGRKENDLLLDGASVGATVAEGTQYADHTLTHIRLTAGTHEVTVSCNWGYVRLDYLEIRRSAEMDAGLYDVEPVLSNPDPSKEAQALMNWMCEIYGEKMISGQYLDEYQYGNELEAVASVTGGRYPAMVGLDLLNYSPSSVSLGSWPTSVDQALGYWKKGYLITYCWHWNAPEKYLDTTGNNWWGGFYTENTTFNLAKALNGEDPEGYDLLIRDMDAIAKQLTRLRDAGVPVLWRPLHEASGGWFWWGASGPEAYIQLYRLMYERFTGEYGLNNLIWVWNGQAADWYPGDDVVDIIGEDIYAGHHAHDSQSAAFIRCSKYTDTKKLIIMSECGCIPSPIKCERDQTMWGAWATWCYEFVLQDGKYSEDYTNAEAMNLFYSQDNVITLADVPDFGRNGQEEPSGEAVQLVYSFADAAVTGNASRTLTGAEIRGNAEGDSAVLTVSVPVSGSYRIVITQSGIGGHKENYLTVDGETVGNTVVQSDAEEACEFGAVWLDAGEHTIGVSAFWGWVSLRTLELIPEQEEGGNQRYEFEEGELLGNVKTGTLGAVSWVELASNDENDGVTVTVNVAKDAFYDLTVVQAGIGGYKENYLAIDGERLDVNTVVQQGNWEDCVTGHIWLTAGEHTVTVTCFWGWARLDALILTVSDEQ
ncbi:MAG: hypothetical protein IJK28_10450 [Clostridia bacterium]|nr:hypothetical protein [Clostridia bacterium]